MISLKARKKCGTVATVTAVTAKKAVKAVGANGFVEFVSSKGRRFVRTDKGGWVSRGKVCREIRERY